MAATGPRGGCGVSQRAVCLCLITARMCEMRESRSLEGDNFTAAAAGALICGTRSGSRRFRLLDAASNRHPNPQTLSHRRPPTPPPPPELRPTAASCRLQHSLTTSHYHHRPLSSPRTVYTCLPPLNPPTAVEHSSSSTATASATPTATSPALRSRLLLAASHSHTHIHHTSPDSRSRSTAAARQRRRCGLAADGH